MQVFLLAREFRRLGHQVCVVSMIQPKYFISDLNSAGVELFDLKMRPGKIDIFALWRYLKIIYSWRPDVIHSHMFHANVFARMASILSRNIPLISTAHNINEVEGSFFRYWLYRMTSRLSLKNTNVSQIARDFYVKNKLFSESRSLCVYNGIEISSFSRGCDRSYSNNAKGFVWLVVGRFVPAKDFHNLLKALDILQIDGTLEKFDARVMWVGDGPLFDEIKGISDNSKYSSRVSFLGIRDDVPKLMATVNGLVMSSAWEGLPITLLEACASRLPFIGTDVGGVREIISKVNSDWLVPAGDSVALSNAMRTLMATSPESLIGSKNKMEQLVRTSFDIRAVANQWLSIYFPDAHNVG